MLATEELIAEAAQFARLNQHLPQVLQRVPLYNGLSTRTVRGTPHLYDLPFITKAEIRRDFPHNFLGADADLDQLMEEQGIELEYTSGTSEPRTPLLLPQGWWAEQERRALRLNPSVAAVLAQTPEPRRVTISSPVCSSEVCFTGVPSHSERTIGNTLFLSLSRYPFLWSEAELARMAAEALAWNPEFLDVDPVYGSVFALYCERHGIKLPELKFILCSYAFVSVVHRRILQRAFDVPVFNLYGSTETGHLLMEDDRGEMRPSLETAFLEVVDFSKSDSECARPRAQQVTNLRRGDVPNEAIDVVASRVGHTPEFGELVVTTLTNELMPLVRYRIGDLVERRLEPYRTCYVVHGRAADAFRTYSGWKVTTWQVDQCFAALSGVVHYQLIERVDDPWRLWFVPDGAGLSASAQSALSSALAELLELKAPLLFEPTDKLLAETSGKFRLGYPARAHEGAGI